MQRRSYTKLCQEDGQRENGKSHGWIETLASVAERRLLVVMLLLSITTNAVFILSRIIKPQVVIDDYPSKYAGLTRNVTRLFSDRAIDIGLNRSWQDVIWNDPDLLPWSTLVALDDSYAESMHLPHSQRWPWDPSKGVYSIAAGHELHCVSVIRQFMNYYQDGVPEEDRIWPYHHAMHCVDLLRQTVMCHADDTPLYIGRLHANVNASIPFAGEGMTRECRDWHALMEWSRRHSACYRPWHEGTQNMSEIERYKFCPDGAKPWLNQGT